MSDTGTQHDSVEVTSPTQWRKSKQEFVTCPSGAKVLIERLSSVNILLTGHVPEALASEYIKATRAIEETRKRRVAAKGREGEEIEIDPAEIAHENLDLSVLTKTVLVAAMRGPRVVWEGAIEEAGEINVEDVPVDDRIFLANYAISAHDSVPVEMKGGETVNLGDLKSDSEDEPGAGVIGDSDSSGEVRTEAV